MPTEVQTAGRSISKLVAGFPDLYIEEVDGCDVAASHEVLGRAIAHCRGRKGPALVHAHVIRPYSHSLSDDEVMYRPPAERDADAARDPIKRLAARLLEEGFATQADLDRLAEEVDAEVSVAADAALLAPQPRPESATVFIYSPDVDPTDPTFDTEASPEFTGEPTTMVDLMNTCMKDEMARDPRILVFGEDVADVSREEHLGTVKGKGGVFKVTSGLQRRFGRDRVYNSPLAEANIVGRAVGLATRGFKPVVEIQFFDYIWPAYDADPQRAGGDAVAVEQRLRLSGRGPRRDRRIPEGRRASTTPRPAPRSSRTCRGCVSSVRPRRSTRTACCAPPSAATIR